MRVSSLGHIQLSKKKKKKKKLKRSSRALVNRCFFCNEEEETIDHILIHYSKARILWDIFFFLIDKKQIL